MNPTAQHVLVLAKHLQVHHQANVVIDPTTGASLEHRHILKGYIKAIWENLFANEIRKLAQGLGTRITS